MTANANQNRKLVKANLALFKGGRGETARLLGDYRAAGGGEPERAPMVLWLDAQAQPDRAERIRRLNLLIANVPPDDPYAQMARQVLLDEETYQQKIAQADARPGLKFGTVLRALALVIVGGLIVLVAVSVLNPPKPETVADAQPTVLPDTPPTAVTLPDNSRPLVADAYTARYPQGILQVTAIEDESVRVIDSDTNEVLTPIPGARFYALNVAFECRGGICDAPPQANLKLQLDDGNLIEPRTGVHIAGTTPLAPIALGRTTSGWIVFEVPTITPVSALIVSAPDEKAFEPITIALADQ
ncbi:MAG: hypothetical protein K8I30_16755 [Anaerolineae bacterium]|nr:hypothetical protein [Anaerolineae bacterium]